MIWWYYFLYVLPRLFVILFLFCIPPRLLVRRPNKLGNINSHSPCPIKKETKWQLIILIFIVGFSLLYQNTHHWPETTNCLITITMMWTTIEIKPSYVPYFEFLIVCATVPLITNTKKIPTQNLCIFCCFYFREEVASSAIFERFSL